MSFRILQVALCVIVIGAWAVEANAQDSIEPEQEWRQLALKHINELQKPKVLGRALFEFTPVRLAAGDIEGASADAVRISNPQLRGYAHYSIARYRKALGDTDGAVAEVNAALESATERGFCFEHVDACLDIAESLPMAKSYVSSVVDSSPSRSSYANSSLVRALAKRGFFKEAMQILNRTPEAKRPRLLSDVAFATAKRREIANTEEILQRISNDKTRDSVYVTLVRALCHRELHDDALKFVSKIKGPVARSEAEKMAGRLSGEPVGDISIEDLKEQISKEESLKARQKLYDSMLKRQLQEKDISGAEATIEAMVKLIKTASFEEEKSKFGNVNDKFRIASVEVNYLQIARLYSERGEMEKSRSAKQLGTKAVNDMPDSSGLGKMLMLPGILASQIAYGEIDEVRKSVRDIKPVFWQQQAPMLVKAFLSDGDTETAMYISETLLNGDGAGGAEIISSFIQAKRMDSARMLLDKVRIESHIGHDACRAVGATMIQTNQTELLKDWVKELPAGVSAHLCIGAARTAGSYLLAPKSSEEEALVSYLAIKKELPAGYSLDEKPYPNPGLHRSTAMPEVAKRFKWHRDGEPVIVLKAAQATFVSEDKQDINVTIYKLKDSDTAKLTVGEMYAKPFSSRYLQKGRYIVFVDTPNVPETIKAADRIQTILTERELPTDK